MKPELQKKLFEKYSKIFADKNKTPQESAMCRGFSCGDGWYKIIDTLCSLLQKATDDDGEEQAVAFQVKEKFGTLRFYLNHTTDLQRAYISFATAMSEKICEYCGTFDDVELRRGGLVRTTCDSCDEKIKIKEKKKFICDQCGEVDAIMFNAYTIGEGLLEGVMIKLTYDEDNKIQASLYSPADDAYCYKLNMKMHFKEAVELAESGDLDNSVCCKCQNDAWRKEDEIKEKKK